MRLVLALMCIFLATPALAVSCLTSSEDYAVEVVIPHYSTTRWQSLGTQLGDERVAQSRYDEKMLLILSETTIPEGLSVTLQLPTEIEERKEPHLKLLSNSATGHLRNNLADSLGRWDITCTEQLCEFTKDSFVITADTLGNRQEVTIDIGEDLTTCSDSCSGICIETPTTSRCLPQKYKTDIETVLRVANISTTFDELLTSYRIVGSEELIITDIVPTVTPYVNWQEALRQELVALNGEGIIQLSRGDIEAISALAKRGQAGRNYRIVLDSTTDEWTYYDLTVNPQLTSERDCIAYTSFQNELPAANDRKKPSVYFLVPLILGITGILLIILLAMVARLINVRTDKKSKKMSSKELTEWNGERN